MVEVWSRTTGHYDFASKLQGYRERGDAETWFIHPYERMLTIWRGNPDGAYTEERMFGGLVSVASLPGVTVELDALFDL